MSVECNRLHILVDKIPKLYIKEMDYINIPSDGIYFITETGETYKGLERIVRIGFNKKKGTFQIRSGKSYGDLPLSEKI
ncbi:hypothetical protein [Ilyobacter polytropus]|uniref:Uncharacterized protein n=1 Tax=Ilyobacter polytropus (strain ATCC 51220 / DSM 2926 / LMG 16218 / CuHBu1) TaxID=572544 RepID=E3H946_ILYPC|nr:hypothetical protein [Ilyobacter polytropus]ADO82745.1 conserved hypothetical protein [Ilyobacter polytropus DSM 2926]